VRVLSDPASPFQVLSGTLGTLIEILGMAALSSFSWCSFSFVVRTCVIDSFGSWEPASDCHDTDARRSRDTGQSIPLDPFVINATYGIAVGIGSI